MTDQQTYTKSTSVLTIAAGVIVGLVVVLIGLWAVISAVTANDGFDCAADNVERVNAGLATKDCG